jgi:hypothetical protein
MAFQSRLDFVAKSALFRPFHFAIVEDASVDRRAVTARRALERETRATEPARARDRETARTRATTTTTRVGRGSVGDDDDDDDATRRATTRATRRRARARWCLDSESARAR